MKLESEPRVSNGPGFYAAVVEWMRRAARAVNPLVDASESQAAQIAALQADIKGPAFSAYLSADVAQTANSSQVILFNTENFDTANCYNPANGRFTPTVQGYYRMSWQVLLQFTTAQGSNAHASLAKNGGEICRGSQLVLAPSLGFSNSVGTDLVFMNGTTDYLQVIATNGTGGGSVNALGAQQYTKFAGELARRP